MKKRLVLKINKKNYIFEDRRIRELESFEGIKDDFLQVISVQEQFFNAGIKRVVAPIKYAHVVLNKRLEEEGELESSQKLWIYKKKSISKTESEVVYSVYPESYWRNLESFYFNYPYGMTIWDIMGFMIGIIDKKFTKEFGMLIVQILDSLFVGIGKKEEYLFFNRYIIPTEIKEGLENTLSIIYSDLLGLENEKSIKANKILWIVGFAEKGEVKKIEFFEDRKLEEFWGDEYKDKEDNRWFSAFYSFLDKISFDYALFGREEKWIYPLDKSVNFVNVALLFFSILGIFTFFHFHNIRKEKETTSLMLNEDIKKYEQKLENFHFPKIDVDLPALLSLFKYFDSFLSSPSYGDFWNMISRVKPKNLYLEDLEIDYKSDAIYLFLKGKIFLPPISAQKEMLKFLNSLKKMNFIFEENNLKIDTTHSSFEVKLKYNYIK